MHVRTKGVRTETYEVWCEKVLSDSFYVWDLADERYNVTHCLNGLTEYHVGIVSKQPSAAASAKLLQNCWCAVSGPPDVLQTDGGKEYGRWSNVWARLWTSA